MTTVLVLVAVAAAIEVVYRRRQRGLLPVPAVVLNGQTPRRLTGTRSA